MGKPWFRTKEFGYGAGMPCSWEGWVALAVFAALAIAPSLLPADLTSAHPRLEIAFRVGLIIGFVVLAWLKSDKPWFWRWNGK
jgi:hypothetical protein